MLQKHNNIITTYVKIASSNMASVKFVPSKIAPEKSDPSLDCDDYDSRRKMKNYQLTAISFESIIVADESGENRPLLWHWRAGLL